MRVIRLDYDSKGLEVALPDVPSLQIFLMKSAPALISPAEKVAKSLARPLGARPLTELAAGKQTACIVVSDKTRPVPNKLILPPILSSLKKAGLKKENITILIGTGTHGPTEGKYLKELLGEKIPREYRIENHDCRDKNKLKLLGKTSKGVPVWINRTYSEAGLKIVTGFIEPHFMAGYSGGRKGVCPGIAGLDTIKVFHSPGLLESSYAEGGKLGKNPCHLLAGEASKLAGIDFLVNVTLNAKKQVTGVFSGHPVRAFQQGVAFCGRSVIVKAREKFDIVLTSGGGAPLDRNFYQTIKGIVGALPAVKKGGTIIVVSGCRDGLGSGDFKKLLAGFTNPAAYISEISAKGFFRLDQWQVEELAKAMKKAKVKIFSEGLPCGFSVSGLERISNIEAELKKAKELNPRLKLGIIPNGPYVLVK